MRVLPGRPAPPTLVASSQSASNSSSSSSSQSPTPAGSSASPHSSSSPARSNRGSGTSRSSTSSTSSSSSSRRRAPLSASDPTATTAVLPSSSSSSSSSPSISSSRPFPRTLSQDGAFRSRRNVVESSHPVVEDGYNSEDEDPLSSSSSSSSSRPLTTQQSDEQREREVRFEKLIRKRRGLALRRVKGDGACMFRAIADQLYGDEEMHRVVRQDALTYMQTESDHFAQFVTEDFIDYLRRKAGPTTYGNNLELQAISELYNRPIEVYSYSIDPIVIRSRDADFIASHSPIRLSYHRNQHYNSLRETATAASLAASTGSSFAPPYEQQLLRDVLRQSAQRDLEDNVVQEARFMSDLERTEREMEEIAIARSLAESVGMRDSSTTSMSGSSPGTSSPTSRASSPPASS